VFDHTKNITYRGAFSYNRCCNSRWNAGLETLGFMLVLTYRAGFREKRWFGWAVVVGLTVVLSFRTALQVRLPSGQLYEFLPPGFRNFMITYF